MSSNFRLFFTQLSQTIDLNTGEFYYATILPNSPLEEFYSHEPNALFINISDLLTNVPGIDIEDYQAPESQDFLLVTTAGSNSFYALDPLDAKTFCGTDINSLQLGYEDNIEVVEADFITNARLEVIIEKGMYKLDALTDLSVIYPVPVDVIEQPCRDYKFVTNLPIQPNNGFCSFNLPWANQTVSELLPSKFSNLYFYTGELIGHNEVVDLNLWESSFNVDASLDVPISVLDSSEVQIQGYRDVHIKQNYYAVLESVPRGLAKANCYVDNLLVSSSYFANSRGYLPAPFFAVDMPQVSLEEAGWGLYGLIAHQDGQTLNLTLKELALYWYTFIFEAKTSYNYGFPDNLARAIPLDHDCWLNNARNSFNNAWLGLAMVKACHYLYNQPSPRPFNPPAYLEKCLLNLGFLCASCVNNLTGLAIKGFSDDGFAIEDYDIKSSILVYIFLNELCSISYHEDLHRLAARAEAGLESLKTDYEGLLANLEVHQRYEILTYLLLLAVYTQDATSQQRLIYHLSSLADSRNAAGLSVMSLSLYLTNFSSGINTPSWALVSANFSNLADGLYKYGAGCSLIASSVSQCIISKTALFTKSFNNYGLNALAYNYYIYTLMRRLTPSSRYWFNDKAYRAYTGIWGNILSALAAGSFDWFVKYMLLVDGRGITLAQGKPLRNWLAIAGVDYKPLQADNYLRSLGEAKLQSNSSWSGLASWLNAAYTDYVIKEPVLPEKVYTLMDGHWEEVPINGLLDLLKIVVKSSPPGFYINPQDFIHWSDFSGIISLDLLNSWNQELVDDINTLAPAGIQTLISFQLNLFIRSYNYISNVNYE